MNRQCRLRQLEAAAGLGATFRGADERPTDLLFLTDDDRVAFDGNERLKPFVGLHVNELPESWWEDGHLRVYKGIDPLVVCAPLNGPPTEKQP